MRKVYNKEFKEKAKALRDKGYSLNEISKILSASKSAVSYWVKDVHLDNKQKLRLKNREMRGGEKGRKKALESNRRKLEDWKKSIRNKVNVFSGLPFKNDKIGKLICGILYLCEGEKYPKSRHLAFVNSDPKIIILFLTLLRKYFNIDENKLRVRVLHRYDQNGEELSVFWSKITNVPLSQFYKNYVDKRTKGNPTKKQSYKGVCAIQYNDVSLQFNLQSIGESVLK